MCENSPNLVTLFPGKLDFNPIKQKMKNQFLIVAAKQGGQGSML
jgi:hypothetical protein